MNRFTLEFAPDVETAFQAHYFRNSLRQVRVSLLLAVVLVTLYGFLDGVLFLAEKKLLWTIRLAFCAPVILGCYALSFSRLFERWMQPAIAATSMLAGLCIIAMTVIVPPFPGYLYYAGLLPILMYMYDFIRLRFVYACVGAWALTFTYIVVAYTMNSVPFPILLSNSFVLFTINIIGMVSCYLAESQIRQNFAQTCLLVVRNQEIRSQHELAESLLLDILPAEIAHELQSKGMVDPRYYEDVTILFTDFKGFSISTEHMAADDLVSRLNDYFTAFDNICSQYGMEKLKTIGDSYMCVGGMPTRNASHAVDAVLAAFEMIEAVEQRMKPSDPGWTVRIGLHTGPVISGVVGIRKFAFDVWGESVNLASRMESSGIPNRINLSGSTYSRVKDFFECEHRGMIATRNKREYDMYFAAGVLPALLDSSGDPLPAAFARRYKTYFQRELTTFPKSLLKKPMP